MSEEKKIQQAERRASSLQRGEEGEGNEAIQDHVQEVKDSLRLEEDLFTKRGYGHYIDTEDIDEIRKQRQEHVAAVEEIRAKA